MIYLADVKWIKIVTDIFDDEKICLIENMAEPDSYIVIWFKLLCLTGKQNRGGLLKINEKMAYTDEMLATIFRRPLEIVKSAIKIFINFGMLEVNDGCYIIANWEKHQNIEQLEKIREQGRKRVAKFRENQRSSADDSDGNVTETDCNATDKNRKEKNKNRIDNNISAESEKMKFGKYKNVLLTDSEYGVLKSEFFDYEKRIENLSEYIASTGRKYKNHLATIRSWAKKEGVNNQDDELRFNPFAKYDNLL